MGLAGGVWDLQEACGTCERCVEFAEGMRDLQEVRGTCGRHAGLAGGV